MDARVPVTLVILLFAGCLDASDDDVAPTTSAMPSLLPAQVYKKEIKACGPTDPDPIYPTAATVGRFELKPGYDQLIIQFHASGEGRISTVQVKHEEEGKDVYLKKDENVNTPPAGVLCGGHAHGPGETRDAEPGNYTTRISYAGQLSIHFEITARSTKANASASPSHSHVPNA